MEGLMAYKLEVNTRLREVYEEMMWLAQRPNVTPQRARAWYTGVVSEALKTKVRVFTGMVSEKALFDPSDRLVLEHEPRLAFRISEFLRAHLETGKRDPDEFIRLIEECERVNITTNEENHQARKANGDYRAAGIELRLWSDIPEGTRRVLWERCLKGKVANASEFS
jgi:hypothetical protein